MLLFDRILSNRGITGESKASFLLPNYSSTHDPMLLPDMPKALDRLSLAYGNQEKIMIYGDYDIDGLTATALLTDAFGKFGFKNVDSFIPSRFSDGYGLTIPSIEDIATRGFSLIVTVDCGSLSEKEIMRAKELGVDVIVTDHHNAATKQPPAVAVVNPKRSDSSYPFSDLSGVGVAFKLVQAMQHKLKGLPIGQEKWLLDLVALGTVCDIVSLTDENRIFVYWGLKVLAKAERPGLKALMLIAGINPEKLNARSIGFGMGPRMNAAGRLNTAQKSLELLTIKDPFQALEIAKELEAMNKTRQSSQAIVLKEAIAQAEKYIDDPVLVLSSSGWNHGIVGIVASKVMERFKKPVFVLQEIGDKTKGSARSFGDFNIADSLKYCTDIIEKGGGHKLAAGVVLPTKNIARFRDGVNKFYRIQNLGDSQCDLLLPKADTLAGLGELTKDVVDQIAQLEPFGQGNPQPILKTESLLVVNLKKMGDEGQHIKLDLQDDHKQRMQFLAFNAPDYFFVEIGTRISVWYSVDVNEWQGNCSVEGKIVHIATED